MIQFQEAYNKQQLDLIENLADVIWHEHYTPIIGKDQVLYMLDKFQSTDTMLEQIKSGYRYYSIEQNNVVVGYLSYEKRDRTLFLSKIYLLKELRGKGIGRQAINFVMQVAKKLNCNKVGLTVNRFNVDSIKAYKKAGFIIAGELVQDIGNGYVMDDYLMEKLI